MRNSKLTISYSILLFINFLFSYKYLSRYSAHGVYLAISILVIQFLIIRYIDVFNFSIKKLNFLGYFLSFLLICFAIISQLYIKAETLNVDRWSVISSFLTELFKGNYPYFAKSQMGNYPGPMPIYFLIALPFYLIGGLNILSALGYIILILIINKQIKSSVESKVLLFLVASSIYVYWEIATKSNIFTYSLFILLALKLFQNTNKNSYDNKFILSAVLSGLLLSTRSVFILAYIVFFISALKNREMTVKSLLIYASISGAVFLFTFLPFIVFFKSDFFIMNPFIIQSSSLIPKTYILLFILMGIASSFYIKNDLDKFFYSGLSLFTSIAIYFVYHIINSGFQEAYFKSGVDISYFLFCLPFLFYYIMRINKNKKPIHDDLFGVKPDVDTLPKIITTGRTSNR